MCLLALFTAAIVGNMVARMGEGPVLPMSTRNTPREAHQRVRAIWRRAVRASKRPWWVVGAVGLALGAAGAWIGLRAAEIEYHVKIEAA